MELRRFRASMNRGELFLAAAAMFSFAATTQYPVGAATAGCLGLLAAILGFRARPFGGRSLVPAAGALSIVVVLLTFREAMAQLSVWAPSLRIWLVITVATGFLAIASIRRTSLEPLVRAFAMLTAVAATLMVLVPHWTPAEASDIYRVHIAAGEAMKTGLNPYSDAVTFESGNPFKPKSSEVIGYPYPTVPLLAYAGSGAFTDPRIVSALAWLGLLGWLGWRSRNGDDPGQAALAALVILSTAPIWRFALFMSWTEPLSIALFAGSLWTIRTKRVFPGVVLLGLALASKQYFVFLAPALVVLRDREERKIARRALVVAAGVAVLPAVLGIREYFDAIVGNSIDIGFRPDTQSLNGLLAALGSDFLIPVVLWVPIVIGLAVLLGRRGSMNQLGDIIVIVMTSVFLMSYAFPNYWMFVLAVAAIIPVVDGVGRTQKLRLGEIRPLGVVE